MVHLFCPGTGEMAQEWNRALLTRPGLVGPPYRLPHYFYSILETKGLNYRPPRGENAADGPRSRAPFRPETRRARSHPST
jgi:hypothetical protein